MVSMMCASFGGQILNSSNSFNMMSVVETTNMLDAYPRISLDTVRTGVVTGMLGGAEVGAPLEWNGRMIGVMG